MPGPCRLCVVVTSPFIVPSDRRCAFDEYGLFRSRNGGCGTTEKLRGLALFQVTAQADGDFMRMAPIAFADRFILLFWRDQSHHIEQAIEVRAGDAFSLTPLSLAFAEEVIASKEARKGRPEPLR